MSEVSTEPGFAAPPERVVLSIAIQHHPSRSELLPPLLESLSQADVVSDPDPDNRLRSAWRTYQRCLRETPDWCTHRMVLQDDVTCCPGFLQAATRAVWARPDRMIAFFVPHTLRRGAHDLMLACGRDEAWVDLRLEEWVPVVALCWPRADIDEFLNWAESKRYTRDQYHRADDAIVGNFAKERRIPVIATVPSLVEHPDEVPSIAANRMGGRRAKCYVGDEAHLLDFTYCA